MISQTIKNRAIWITLLIAATLVLPASQLLRRGNAGDAEQRQSSLSEQLIGTWVLVGKPYQVGEPPKAGGRLKFFTGNHWCITQAHPETGKVIFHHGGTYVLDGDKYVETFEYANESTAFLIKKTINFRVTVEGDTYTQIGIDNPFTEVWKRL